jgi:hypothetical protein
MIQRVKNALMQVINGVMVRVSKIVVMGFYAQAVKRVILKQGYVRMMIQNVNSAKSVFRELVWGLNAQMKIAVAPKLEQFLLNVVLQDHIV